MDAIKNAARLAQMILKRQIKSGDTVIDATCGTGQDTLFLAQMVGPSGRVLGFDIQSRALDSTREILAKHNCLEQVSLIHDNHANLPAYIHSGVSAGMFNLGYLPGGDHSIKTNSPDTLQGVNSLLEVLIKGGVLTVVSYLGHEGGQAENADLRNLLSGLPQKQFEVTAVDFINQLNYPPQLFCITKL